MKSSVRSVMMKCNCLLTLGLLLFFIAFARSVAGAPPLERKHPTKTTAAKISHDAYAGKTIKQLDALYHKTTDRQTQQAILRQMAVLLHMIPKSFSNPVNSKRNSSLLDTALRQKNHSTIVISPDPQVYTIRFSSRYNHVNFVVQNTSLTETAQLRLSLENKPLWLRRDMEDSLPREVVPGGIDSMTYVFSLDRNAPIADTITLNFLFEDKSGGEWSKSIRLRIAPPDNFRLLQNFPNPFNPTTNITAELPTQGHVDLLIFNLLGQEVANLYSGPHAAGYFQQVWNASMRSSGTYFYELKFRDAANHVQVQRKKMLLIR